MYVRIYKNISFVKLHSGGNMGLEKFEKMIWRSRLILQVWRGKGGNNEGDKGIKGEVVEGKKNCQGMKVHCWRGLREGRSERWLIAGVEWCSSEVEALHSRILVPKGDERRLQHWKLTRSHKVSVCALNACSGNRTVVSSGCVSKENL